MALYKCHIWIEYEAGVSEPDAHVVVLVKSPRAGGSYRTKENDIQTVNEIYDDWVAARLTTIPVDRRTSGDREPLISIDIVDQAFKADPLPIDKREERLLLYLKQCSLDLGEEVVLTAKPFQPLPNRPTIYYINRRNAWHAMAHSEASKWEEILFLASDMEEKHWIVTDLSKDGYGTVKLLPNGYRQIYNIENQNESGELLSQGLKFDPLRNISNRLAGEHFAHRGS